LQKIKSYKNPASILTAKCKVENKEQEKYM